MTRLNPGVRDRRYATALKAAQQKNADLKKVATLLDAAHDAGDARATYALATWYLHGRFFKKSLRKAVRLLRKAAQHNIADALYDLAVCYEAGCGLVQDESKAVVLYVRAALAEHEQSIYEVGRCYYHGIGVAKDRLVARAWLDKARQLGIKD